mmetsp:Transcript_2359/g.5104  ORF Transcript_2359/g.5104 Transcript_2359/m.5104 type:complete len:82 (-) Transcript_2359:374-619(-)
MSPCARCRKFVKNNVRAHPNTSAFSNGSNFDPQPRNDQKALTAASLIATFSGLFDLPKYSAIIHTERKIYICGKNCVLLQL